MFFSTVCPLNGATCLNGGTFDGITCECVCPATLFTTTCEGKKSALGKEIIILLTNYQAIWGLQSHSQMNEGNTQANYILDLV